MVIVDTKHALANGEVYCLRQLIGKVLTTIHSSRVDNDIEFKPVLDPVNLTFSEMTGFIVISADFDETNFGDDFIKINIEQTIEPIGINRSQQIGAKLSPLNLKVLPEFKIIKIEVYGSSYFCESDNIELKPYWKIEIDNPGQKIRENIETENTLLFYSENSKLLIKPYGPVPWFNITFDNQIIDQLLLDKDLDGQLIKKFKHEIQ
jgi:hypothetical protein